MITANQCTKRNLIEAKKNKSLQWLDTQPTEKQKDVLKMAAQQRMAVKAEYKRHVASVKEQRQ